jgi:hydroxyacylglutathione hydrolase
LVGCQKSGEAVVVDPGRDIQQYLDVAAEQGLKVVAVAETHIHADYVSGARQLADQHGAKLYVSDEGPADWKYEYADEYDHQLLKHEDSFHIGKIEFKVLHTPGHTPESISFMLTDHGGGADQPMGIFTGDFMFVGSIGRPDLLEEAAGMQGTADAGARDLFSSAQAFKTLPDYLQIWPAHGAGSACGKGLGAIPSSTVGYEKRFNPALQYENEQEFVDYILSDQPEAPSYFAVMKRVNKLGPAVLDGRLPPRLEVSQIADTVSEHMTIDLGPANRFAEGHVPGSINISMGLLAAWAGWLVDYERPLYLIAENEQIAEATRVLQKIGIEKINGYFDADEVAQSGHRTGTYERRSASDVAAGLERQELILIDVRGDSEWHESHIEQAQRCFLAKLPEKLKEYEGDCSLAFQCRTGGRSAIAASLAKAAGVSRVINMQGGIDAWMAAGLPVAKDSQPWHGPDHEASAMEAACQSQAVFWNGQCPPRVRSTQSA